MSEEANAEMIKPSIKTIQKLYMWEYFKGQDDWTSEAVSTETEPDDHGFSETLVFHRKSDDTFWEVTTLNQSSDDYDSLRDGDLRDSDITQVWPHTITTTEYRNSKP